MGVDVLVTPRLIGVVLSIAIGTLLQVGCGTAKATGPPPPPPGPTEPVFNAATDTTLFWDGWESYATTASLTDGSGAHRYLTASGGLSGITQVTGGAFEGSKQLTFDYQAPGGTDRLLENWDTGNAPGNAGQGPDVVVTTFMLRQSGTPAYAGKVFIEFPSNGAPRFLMHHSTSPSYPASLKACWWNSGGNPLANRPDTPSDGIMSPTWNRDDVSLPGGAGYSYKQNMGKAFNLSAVLVDGNWHRYTTRFSKGDKSVYGRGRVEMWVDGTKITEYIGDDATRCEYGQVYVPNTVQLVRGFQFPGPAAFNWPGGATTAYDAIHVWVPAK